MGSRAAPWAVLFLAVLLLVPAASANHLTSKSFTVFESPPNGCNVRAFEGDHGWTSVRNQWDAVELLRGDGETGADLMGGGVDRAADEGTDCSGTTTLGRGNPMYIREEDTCCASNGQKGFAGWVDRGFDLDDYVGSPTTLYNFSGDKGKPNFAVTSASLDFDYGVGSVPDYNDPDSLSYLYAYMEPGDTGNTNGLHAAGFSDLGFTGVGCAIVTPNINYGDDVGTNVFGGGSVSTPCGGDTYLIRWTGYINIPTTASDWFIRFDTDDRGRVWIDGNLVIDDWVDSGCVVSESGALALSAGFHTIEVEYAENTGGTCANLYWRSATAGIGAGTIIPSSSLFTKAQAAASPTDITSGALRGYWRDGSWFGMNPFFSGSAASASACTATTLNAVINFADDVGTNAGAPATCRGDTYSAMWVGFVNTPTAGSWTFYLRTDDGGFLVVDDRVIFNDAATGGCATSSGTIALSAGWHRIQVFFSEDAGGTCAALGWSGPGAPPCGPADATGGGLCIIPAGNLGYSGLYRFDGDKRGATAGVTAHPHGPDYEQVWDPSSNVACPLDGNNPTCTQDGTTSLTNIFDLPQLGGGGTSQTLTWFFNNIATASRAYRVYFWSWAFVDVRSWTNSEGIRLTVDDARIPTTYNYFGYNIIVNQIRIGNGSSGAPIASRNCTAAYTAPPMDGTCEATNWTIPNFLAGDYIYLEARIQHRGDSGDPTSTRPVVGVEFWRSNDANTARDWRNDTWWDGNDDNRVTTNPANGLQCAEGDLNGAGGTARWQFNTETGTSDGQLAPGESLTVLCRVPTSTFYGYNPMPDGFKLDFWIHVRDALVDADHAGGAGDWWNDSFTQLAGFGADTMSVDNAKIDGYRPVFQGASWVSGCRNATSTLTCWVRPGDSFAIDNTHFDNGTYDGADTGPRLNHFVLNRSNLGVGWPYDNNHYCVVDVGFDTFCAATHWTGDQVTEPTGQCKTSGGCTGTTAQMRWSATINQTTEYDWDVAFFMYDHLFNGQGYTWPGHKLRVDNTAPTSAGSMTYTDTNITFETFFPVTWSAGSDARSGIQTHFIQRETGTYSGGTCTPSGTWVDVANISYWPTPTTSWTDAGLTADGTCYRWRVISRDFVGFNNSAPSAAGAWVRKDETFPTPAQPNYAAANITSATSYTVTWTAGSDAYSGLKRYYIQRATSPYSNGQCTGFGTYVDITNVDPGTLSYLDTGLTTDGLCYRWRIITQDWHNLNSTSADGNIVRKDDTLPVVTFNNPDAGTWFRRNFIIDIFDSDSHSGLQGCFYQVESSADGSTWTTTQSNQSRACNSAASATIGIWSNSNGEDCVNSGPNRCRVTVWAKDWHGNQVPGIARTFSIDWDGPFINVSGPVNQSWQNGSYGARPGLPSFPVTGPESDQPSGGAESGLFNCSLRVFELPLPAGAWVQKNVSDYPCAGAQGEPNVSVGASGACSVQGAGWPDTCLVVVGATDQVASGRNPSMLYYSMDNGTGTVAVDLGPRGVNGTLTSGASWALEGGFRRHGASLDGFSGSINVSLPSDLTGGPLTNFTAELWVKPAAAANRGILSFCDFGASQSCDSAWDRHLYTDGSGNLCYRVWPHIAGTCSTQALSVGNWSHVALRVRRDVAQNLVGASLFWNGSNLTAVHRNLANHSEFDWATRLLIGFAPEGGLNRFFSGTVDEVKIHFRPLNDTEIAWAAAGQEQGGAQHIRVDYTAPATMFNNPPAGSTQTAAFDINISDSDANSGLALCEFRVENPVGTPTYPNPANGSQWAARLCDSPNSTTIFIGTASGMCTQNDTLCNVCVRSRDNAHNYGPSESGVCRSFHVVFFAPNLRVETPVRARTVGLYTNDSETCKGTVGNASSPNCQNWWYARLRERGFHVVNVTGKSSIDSVAEMRQFTAILNPYGERFPGTGGSPDANLVNIRDFVTAGGFWLESGGHSFWDPGPGMGAPGAAHSQDLCLNIGNLTTGTRNRTLNATNATSFPSAPQGFRVNDPAALDRPSLGNINFCGFDQSFEGIFVNQTGGARYGPALHCYTKGCVVRTDNTTPESAYALSPHPVADVYADVLRYWLNANRTLMVEDDRFIWDLACSYHVESPPGTNTTGNVSRLCDQDVNLTVGPFANRHCPQEGADRCKVFINSTNQTGGTVVSLLYGIDWTPPNVSITITESSPCAYAPNNTWVYYSNSAYCPTGGSFTVDSGASDAVSGIARVEFPNATVPGTSTISPGPHTLDYSFDGATTFTGWVAVKAVDNASNPFPSAYGLEGWWRLNEGTGGSGADVMDASGNGRNGSLAGPPVWVTGPGVNFSGALRFAGVAAPRVGLPNFGSFSNFTVSAWVYRNTSYATNETVVSYKDTGAACGFNLSLNQDLVNQRPTLGVNVGGTWRWATDTAPLPLNQWVHLAGTYDGSNISLYRNGTLAARSNFPGAMNQCTQNSSIGNRALGATNNSFPGVIDDVKIWSRALGDLEINNSEDAWRDDMGIGPFRVYRDYSAPSGNTGPDYCSGTWNGVCYNTSLGVLMNLPPVSDAESGIPAGGRLLMNRNANLSGGVCGEWSPWYVNATDPPTPYNDTGVIQGRCYQYSYNVTDNVANWANVSSANVARVDITGPSLCGTPTFLTESSPYGHVNGTTVYYNPTAQGGSYTLTVWQSSDPESGIANITFPATTSAGGVNLTSPPHQWNYTWNTASTYNQTTGALCYNNAGASNNTTFTVFRDVAGPQGNTGPSYTDGYYNVESVTITLPAVTENGSGIASNGRILQRRSATLSAQVCGAWSAWSDLAYDPASPYPDTSVATGNCYQYSYNTTDNVANWANATSASIARIDISPPVNGSIYYFDGANTTPADVWFEPGDDPESGLANWSHYRRNSTLDCSANPEGFSNWGLVTNSPTPTLWTDSNLTSNLAFQWKLVVRNLADVPTEYVIGNIYKYNVAVDPNVTRQLTLYEWNATYSGAPVSRWAFHNSSCGVPDGFIVEQTSASIRLVRPGGSQTFAGHTAAAGETHSYKVAYDYACGSGNYTYVYRNGTYVGRVGGPALPAGDCVAHQIGTNTQVNSFVTAPGRWDPPLAFSSSSTGAPGCTNFVLDSCQISGARPCTGGRTVNSVFTNLSVYRPGAEVLVTPSFTCTVAGNDTAISYNSGNSTGWVRVGYREATPPGNTPSTCSAFTPVFANAGNPGVHRVRASVRDTAEGSSWNACFTWDADNDDVAFWVAEPVRG